MTTTTLHVTAGPGTDQQIGGQVAHAVRRYGRPTTVRQSAPAAAVPFRHTDLFREPVYTDGQPYADDDLEDDGEDEEPAIITA